MNLYDILMVELKELVALGYNILIEDREGEDGEGYVIYFNDDYINAINYIKKIKENNHWALHISNNINDCTICSIVFFGGDFIHKSNHSIIEVLLSQTMRYLSENNSATPFVYDYEDTHEPTIDWLRDNSEILDTCLDGCFQLRSANGALYAVLSDNSVHTDNKRVLFNEFAQAEEKTGQG